jgi:hypothetical protein
MTYTEDFKNELINILTIAKELNIYAVEIKSKDLYDKVSNDTDTNRMPICCNAMHEIAKRYKHKIINTTQSGQSTTLQIRYYL